MVAAVVEDLPDPRHPLRLRAVHLELNLDAVVLRERAALARATCRSARASSLPARPSAGRSAAPSRSASRGRFASFTHSLVSSMFLRTTAGSGDVDTRRSCRARRSSPAESANCFRTSARAAGESAISTPCLCVVRSSTASNPDLGEVLDDGRDVPVLRDVVGDGAELQRRAACCGLRRRRWVNGRQRRHSRHGGEEVAPVHEPELTAGGRVARGGKGRPKGGLKASLKACATTVDRRLRSAEFLLPENARSLANDDELIGFDVRRSSPSRRWASGFRGPRPSRRPVRSAGGGR